jgi:hypothetical protein
MASSSTYLDRLASLPALQRCSRRQLVQVAQLVDEVTVDVGDRLPASAGQVTIALEPTRVLVVDRRALPALRELVPDLFAPGPVGRPRYERLPWVPSWSPSSA